MSGVIKQMSSFTTSYKAPADLDENENNESGENLQEDDDVLTKDIVRNTFNVFLIFYICIFIYIIINRLQIKELERMRIGLEESLHYLLMKLFFQSWQDTSLWKI